MREGRRQRVDIDALSSLAFLAIAGAIIGAKALMVLGDLPEYVSTPSDLLSLSVLTSAGDFYGGFIGALIASVITPTAWPRRLFERFLVSLKTSPPDERDSTSAAAALPSSSQSP